MQALVDGAQQAHIQPSPSSGVNFNQVFQNALSKVNETQMQASKMAEDFQKGADISLSDVMIASQKSTIAFQATMQVRNRLVEAYKEIMNMPM